MDFVNNLPLPAKLSILKYEEEGIHYGFVTAKATYKFDSSGEVELDTENPYPIHTGEVETEFGVLPSDVFPKTDPSFEVFLLGQARTPNGEPAVQTLVTLDVGAIRREILVTGDRVMTREGSNKDAQISPPVPFTVMPLTYAQAFGGSFDVEIDRESYVTVADPNNQAGKGFDPGPQAKGLCKILMSPKGYPVYDETRQLPNLEDPNDRVLKWDDTPRPVSWATLAMGMAPRGLRAVELPEGIESLDPQEQNPLDAAGAIQIKNSIFHQACDDWIIPTPTKDSSITMTGVSHSGPISFQMPATNLYVDYLFGTTEGTEHLNPTMLVLLPEEMRFYVVHRIYFDLTRQPGVERSLCLRGGEF